MAILLSMPAYAAHSGCSHPPTTAHVQSKVAHSHHQTHEQGQKQASCCVAACVACSAVLPDMHTEMPRRGVAMLLPAMMRDISGINVPPPLGPPRLITSRI